MTEIVKVSCFPNEGTPSVIDGFPSAGDLVRITTPTGAVVYERYTPPAEPVETPAPPPSSTDIILKRLDQLEAKIEAITGA